MEELNQLEQVLGAPDAIMEPSILNVLRRYMSDGGNPATAVEMLSDNYTGMLWPYDLFYLQWCMGQALMLTSL